MLEPMWPDSSVGYNKSGCAHRYVFCVYFSGLSEICGLRSYRVTYAEDTCRCGVNRSFVVTIVTEEVKWSMGFQLFPVCACFGGRADDWLFLSALFLRFEVFFQVQSVLYRSWIEL